MLGEASKAELAMFTRERKAVMISEILPGMALTGMAYDVQLIVTNRPDGK